MDDSLKWSIEYYKNANGSSPVLKFIKNLQGRDQRAVLRGIERLENQNTGRSMVYRIDDNDELWVLRIFASNSCRLIYFHDDQHEDRRIVILHGFLKKTNAEIPKRIIQLAQQRYKNYLLSV